MGKANFVKPPVVEKRVQLAKKKKSCFISKLPDYLRTYETFSVV